MKTKFLSYLVHSIDAEIMRQLTLVMKRKYKNTIDQLHDCILVYFNHVEDVYSAFNETYNIMLIKKNIFDIFTQREQLNFITFYKMTLKKESFKYLKTKHSFHLVDPSPWPLVASLGAFIMVSGGVLYMHRFTGGWVLFITGFFTVLYVMYTWWRDIIREATFEEQHTFAVQRGLRLGTVSYTHLTLPTTSRV